MEAVVAGTDFSAASETGQSAIAGLIAEGGFVEMIKKYLGAMVYDWPRLLTALFVPCGWIRMRNRNDRLTDGPAGLGVKCEWEYSKSLHLCDLFPSAANLLLRKALRQWPVLLQNGKGGTERSAHGNQPSPGRSPNISFIIGHRGPDRIPHLLMTLRAIQQQKNIDFECIVIEQDAAPLIQDSLPDWVRYKHAPRSADELRYNRSAAFNEGVCLARGEVLILHDNDLLVPAGYAAEAWRLYQAGYEVMQMKRFIFYLDGKSSAEIFTGGFCPARMACEKVFENMEGGGSLVIAKNAYQAVGGMDEEFVGWGGEDNEFWNRCLTRKVWEYGYLPFIHLWHVSLADRRQENPMMSLLKQKLSIRPEQRIQQLLSRQEAECN
jgi:hypothetical protein